MGVFRPALLGLLALAACNGVVGWGELTRVKSSTVSSRITGKLRIAMGFKHTCATLEDRTIACWGANEHGQLGLGHTDRVLVPTRVPDVEDVEFLSVGRAHTCVSVRDGSVYCWGSNESAQLGIGPADTEPHPDPEKVECSAAAKVQASKGHTCIETRGRTVECWGANQYGQIGDGTSVQKSIATKIAGLTGVEKLSNGNGDFTCAVASNPAGGDAVFCWGNNDKGQLGQPVATTSLLIPTIVPGIVDADKVYIGQDHACATLPDTTARCWGANSHGQLGDGTADTRFTPADVKGFRGADIAPGFAHSCGLDTTGTAKCWGSNEYGQVGNKKTGGDVLSPTSLGSGWESVTVDGDSSCGVREGIAYCWGRNDEGQLGNGTTDDSNEPVPVKLD